MLKEDAKYDESFNFKRLMKQSFYILIALFFSLSSFGQAKYGYIDYTKAVQTLPDYQSGQEELDLKISLLKDSINMLAADYQEFILNGLPCKVVLDSSEIALLDDSLLTMQNRVSEYQEYATTEMEKAQNSLDIKLKNKIILELEKYCSNNGIVCIGYKNSMLYCSECVDYTADFIEYLKERN